MNKNYLSLLFAALFLFAVGCKNGEDTTPAREDFDKAFAVTLDEAKVIARNAYMSRVINPGSSKRMLKRNITNSTTVSYKGRPSFHIFNYEGGGFTIISGDKRTMPIMAYSDDSNYSFAEKEKPGGLKFWERATQERIQMVKTLSSTAEPAVLNEWTTLSCPVDPVDPQERLDVYCGGGNNNTKIITTGPLLHTTWDQGCNYNDFTPISHSPLWGLCGHCPTGCVATSVAQVMNYWHYPASYNWSAMDQTQGTTETSRLMREIGTAVGMIYGDEGSSAYAYNIPGVFKTTYGYPQADYKEHFGDDYSAILGNIRISRPVILGGCDTNFGCHSWVCDGYQNITSAGFSFLNLHMNWGWGGDYDGWFTFDNWTIKRRNGTTYNFQFYQDMVANIHPPQN